jgi:enoyl-CoA hydratase/carnithine racemase
MGVMSEALGDEPIVVTMSESVATIWLNRPDKRNAMSHEMWTALAQHCHSLANDHTVRVLVVRGVGGHFCAGADIGGFADGMSDEYQAQNREAEEALAAFPRPTIAFITGSCVGGGVQIAGACDLRFADTTAKFGITPARLGIAYPTYALERAVRLVGPSAAKHLLFSAELIDVERALRIGLIDEVAEPEAAVERLEAFTSLLANERSLLTQTISKEMVNEVAASGGVSAQMIERWAPVLANNPDMPEGVAAFAERRSPNFVWTPEESF